MNHREHYHILIVGGGLAGTALAAALHRSLPGEVRIAILETNLQLPEYSGTHYDPRVVALNESSRDFLTELGVWDSIGRVSPFSHMTVWDAEGTGQIDYDASLIGSENLGHIVENSALLKALRESLARAGNVLWLAPERLATLEKQPAGYSVTCDSGRRVACDLLVAADGARSRVRELAGFTVRQWPYGQSAIVTTVTTARGHRQTAWQNFLVSGPLAFLPLSDERHCSIVWSLDEHKLQEIESLSDEAFCQALSRASEGRLGEITACEQRFTLPLQQRHASRYIQDGVCLVADAAHTIHPLAGQGINLGFLDVQALAKSLSWAQERRLPYGSVEVLQRYERERMTHNLSMMAAMESFKRLFGSRNLVLRWLRNTGLTLVDGQPLLKRFFVKASMHS